MQHSKWLIALAWLLLSAAGASAADAVRFTSVPLAEGTKFDQTWSRSVDAKAELTAQGKTQQVEQTIEESGHKRVVFTAADTIEVEYVEFAEPDPDVRHVKDLVGKTYAVKSGVEIEESITYAGNAVHPPVLELVLVNAGNIEHFEPNRLATLLTESPVQIGQRLRLEEEDYKHLFSQMCDLGTKGQTGVELTLREVKDDQAVFTVKQRQVEKLGFAEVVTELAGELKVEVDTCRPISLELTGPAHGEGTTTQNGVELSMTVDGKMNVRFATKYDN